MVCESTVRHGQSYIVTRLDQFTNYRPQRVGIEFN